MLSVEKLQLAPASLVADVTISPGIAVAPPGRRAELVGAD
jgi:hypothetical protein